VLQGCLWVLPARKSSTHSLAISHQYLTSFVNRPVEDRDLREVQPRILCERAKESGQYQEKKGGRKVSKKANEENCESLSQTQQIAGASIVDAQAQTGQIYF
ncbi:hypothetical protein QOZ28_31330, partial [Pseudomonas aeruginosa]|uniref:hypothetical protein n=1 Tax=Pseudomonas aeruginosa TaxID=287 RepID=UPI0034581D21